MSMYKTTGLKTIVTFKMRFFIGLAILLVAVSANNNYEGYKVFRMSPSSEDQIKTLSSLNENEHFDFWSPIRNDGKPIDVMVDSHTTNKFEVFLQKYKINYEVLIKDVQEVVQAETERQVSPCKQPGKINFKKYNRHSVINAYLDQLAAEYPETVSVEKIGQSYEDRNLKVIIVSTDRSANKPIIFIDAGIHGREWIAPAQAIYIIHQLVENPKNLNLLDKVDWHILPVFNPDGYEYTHTNERFWRKTRSKGNMCFGTDGNRNFDFHWGEIGASPDECSDTYMGKKPFSEVEGVAVRDYLFNNKESIKLYLTLHSYGEYILFPWGFTSALPDDYDELQALGETVANEIARVRGTVYTVGTSTNVLYPAAGGTDDWAKGVAGIQLSYTIELPGGGSSGFDPPPNQILNIVEETWSGILIYHYYVASKFG